MSSSDAAAAYHDAEAGSNNHVKFNLQEEEFKSHHENLEINELGRLKYNVNLGYLKMDHYYKVAIDLKMSHASTKFAYIESTSSKYISFNDVKIKELAAADADHHGKRYLYSLVIVFHVHKEKLDKEIIYFQLDDHERLELHIEAKVLGVTQGTPLLRNGITLLHNHSNGKKNSQENLHFNIN